MTPRRPRRRSRRPRGAGPGRIRGAFRELGDHQVVGVVVLAVAGPDLVEVAGEVLLGAEGAREQEQSEPGGGVGGEQGGGAPAGVLGGGGAGLAAQGGEDGGAGEEGGGVGALGFGEQPFAGPGGGRRGFGEDHDAVAAAVPVVAGADEQGAGPGPAALGELGAHVDEFGVAEGRVEELGVTLAGAAEGRRRRGHPRVSLQDAGGRGRWQKTAGCTRVVRAAGRAGRIRRSCR